MTVAQLIEALQDLDPEAEVRLAEQPRWAFEYDIKDVIEVAAFNECAVCGESVEAAGEPVCRECHEDHEGINELPTQPGRAHPAVIYLVEGKQLGYLPRAAADEIGWHDR